ncbi:SPOR domain-containing protein [Paucibacter sp. APW11]|uniref:SPOR domain-containing protein n=1 Tax=Roseateles aquae TaxID=3077235 RepID=A0ABU3PA14_9BURK|nr:SPOR domain-containing protein [Paucibacter sp. APW11]MDT8999426.1 SPOR domain-containing protein [Paucibacter sp. APW11]
MAQGGDKQRGGFVLGLIVGLLLGLAIALGVALYITKVPIPFINKVPQRTAEQDAEEAARNKNWDPNAPLAGKAAVKAASGVVSPAPGGEAAAPSAPAKPETKADVKAEVKAEAKPEAKAEVKPEAKAEVKADAKPAAKAASAPPADPNLYFIQAGAYTKPEDAEQQRAKLAIQGFAAKVFEKEQSGRTVYRVRLGPIDARDEAEALQHKLEAAGIEANLVPMKR